MNFVNCGVVCIFQVIVYVISFCVLMFDFKVLSFTQQGGRNSNMVNLEQNDVHQESLEATPGGYNITSRR